jgi:S-adenosylmethionine:diacylglycerol 3-amino-3-carboxypropyl transferase
MQHLELTGNDSVFAIASAGDNILHYAINGRPKRIHAVDMNPWLVLIRIRLSINNDFVFSAKAI